MDVSRLVLGTMYLGTRTDEATSRSLLDRVLAAGGRTLDTQGLLADGRPSDALVYLLATVAGGFAASVGGLAVGRALRTRGAP